MSDISSLGEGRITDADSHEFGGGVSRYGDWTAPKARALVCFTPETQDNKAAAAAALGRIQYFDWISSALPERIPANSCQPYWLSVKVPVDALPGSYRGTIRVEGPGFSAVTLTLEAEETPPTATPPPPSNAPPKSAPKPWNSSPSPSKPSPWP